MFYTKHNQHSGKFLPHQKNDIKPETINAPSRQKPPLLTEEEKKAALNAPIPKISLREAPTDVHIGPPKPAIPKQSLTMPPKMNIIGIDTESPLVPVALKLLNKLGIIKNLQAKLNTDINEHLRKIMVFVKKTHLVTEADVIDLNNVGKKEAKRELGHLVWQKKLVKHGSGKKTFYKQAI